MRSFLVRAHSKSDQSVRAVRAETKSAERINREKNSKSDHRSVRDQS